MRAIHIIKTTMLLAAATMALAGCAKKTPTPQTASSAGSPSYALGYPGEVSENLTRYTDHTVDVKDNNTAFKTYPDALSDPDWQGVSDVYTAADEAGRGEAFADAMAKDRHVREFFDEEKDDLTRRTSGAVANAVKKADCNCEPETGGAVAFALKDGVEKRLEKRLLEAGGAAALIEEQEKRLGKKNLKPLEEQSAAIAYNAYVVFVELPTIYQTLERRLDEAKAVKQTLASERQREKQKLEDPTSTKAQKKTSEKRIAEIDDALSTIAIFEEESKQLVARGIEEIPAIQDAYEEAFKTLLDDVQSRIAK